MSDEIKNPKNEDNKEESFVAVHDHQGTGYNVEPETRVARIITDEEYLETRVENQRQWYDNKASLNQKRYKNLKLWEIILAASIPVLITVSAAGVIENANIISKIVVEDGVQKVVSLLSLATIFQFIAAAAGVVLVIMTKVLELENYYKNWIEYRDMAEKIEREKMLYVTRTEPYDESNAYALFVEIIEGLLAKEIQKWKQIPKAQMQNELLDKAQESINKNKSKKA